MESRTTNNPDVIVYINFNKPTGTVIMDYGTNEDDNWQGFASLSLIWKLHKDIDSSYIRVRGLSLRPLIIICPKKT